MKLKWNLMDLLKICGCGLFSSTISEVLGFVDMARILDDCNSFKGRPKKQLLPRQKHVSETSIDTFMKISKRKQKQGK